MDSINQLVLAVDDNRDAVSILGRLLALKGFSVHMSVSGQDGLDAATRLHPDAAVLDLAMPDLDGYDLCKAIRDQSCGKSTFIIALSGYGGAVEREKSKKAGFDAHLTKTVDLDVLIRLLDDNQSLNFLTAHPDKL